MALIQYYSNIVIFILCSTSSVFAADNFVTPSKNAICPAYPCLILNEYVREVDRYFRDNTTFKYLSGSDQLDGNLHLENASVTWADLGGGVSGVATPQMVRVTV